VGWASPAEAVGKSFSSPGSGKPDGVVIGVVEDYHHHGLQERIQPLMFGCRQVNGYFMLRVQNGKYGDVIHSFMPERHGRIHFGGSHGRINS